MDLSTIRNRIVEFRQVKGKDLLNNERNWRLHPEAQADALHGILSTVGIADSLLAYYSKRNNGKLTLIDGHLRKNDTDPEQEWPVQITDLNDEEADLLLSLLDPIGAMATMDAAKFLDIQENVTTDDWRVREALRKMAIEAEAMLREEEKEKEEEPANEGGPDEMELLPFEHYDYVVIFFKNQLDWLAAQEILGVEKRQDPRKTNKVGLCRVLDGAKFVNWLREKSGELVVGGNGS